MDLNRIWANENQLKALTGLTKIEADDLLIAFRDEIKLRNSQKRGPGGRPPKLDTKGIFIMLMMLYRHYISIEALGAIFNLNASNVKRWLDDAQGILKEILKKKNFSHLIVPKDQRKLRKPLNSTEKSILMGLNNLFAGQVTK